MPDSTCRQLELQAARTAACYTWLWLACANRDFSPPLQASSGCRWLQGCGGAAAFWQAWHRRGCVLAWHRLGRRHH